MNRVPAETALGLAWIVALVASLAALFIGEVMGQTPCVLCWFQRAFMFPLAIILGLGLWWRDGSVGRYGIALALGGGRGRPVAHGPLRGPDPRTHPAPHGHRPLLHR